jgi:DNA modification methylase
VAAYHGRRSVGIDLNAEYLELASVRAARGRYEGSARVRGLKPRL